VPHPLARPLLSFLWKNRFTSFPEPELDHIRYVCMVDGGRAGRELGFKARHTLKQTIRAVDG
jgi:UDP-glucose 4-epimerase